MLKNLGITMLLAAMLLTACSAGPAGNPEPVSQAEEESQDIELTVQYGFIDLREDTATEEEYRLMALVWTGIARQTWESPEEIEADQLIDFYRMMAGDLYSEVVIPEEWETDEDANLLMPADAVEQKVQQHFHVSTQRLHTSSYYDPAARCYRHGGLGSVANALITEYIPGDNDGPAVIVYELFQDDEHIGTGRLTLEMSGDEYRYLSNVLAAGGSGG